MVAATALVLGGCGGDSSTPGAARATSPSGSVQKRPCRKQTAATKHAALELARDVRAIKRAAARPTRDRLLGNAAMNRATDRFLLDEGSLPVDNFTRNRYINLAIAAAVSSCQQCFQALEAARPITQASLNQAGALPCPQRKS